MSDSGKAFIAALFCFITALAATIDGSTGEGVSSVTWYIIVIVHELTMAFITKPSLNTM